MCGIAGAFALTPGLSCDASTVRRMATVLRHRGPDGEGFWSDASSRLCLGHRRLSIIDLATGQQPMHDPDTGTAIVFNGEIYNYVELRRQLIDKGCTFRTESDTEVLLALYRLMGTDALHHLRGMFALALWDPRSATLLLARDRIGKKPLYYTTQSGILYFASSFAAIATILRSPHDVDLPQLDAFLTLGYIPAPATIHPAVKKLPAGTFATVDRDGLHLSSFWDPAREIVPYEGTWDQAVERLDELVTTAVAIRLRADVPLGVLLSGGVDSSLVAAVAARRSSHPVQTFSIGFDDVHSHELSYAGAVAQHIGSDHRAFRVASDAVDLIPQLVRHFGEPFGDPSAAPAWLVAQEARRHVTVAVGGDGGDEGFAGYDWYETAARLTRVTRRVPTALRQAFSGFRSPLLPAFGSLGRLSRAAALLTLDESHRYLALRSLLDSRVARCLYSPQLQEVHRLADTERTAVLDTLFRATPGSSLRRMRTLDIKTYLAECLMPKLDVTTMAHGLEARAPLLDHELLQFALSLPDAWILANGSRKKLLRTVLYRYVPSHLVESRKRGFDPPLAAWFSRHLRPRIEALSASNALRETGWFQPEGIGALAREHLRGQRDNSLRLYNLLVLDQWLRDR
jgi:asparagine synthase (glutamine-hydrolysing)